MTGIQNEQKLVQIKSVVSAYWNTLTDDLWDAVIEEQQQESQIDEAQVAYLNVPKTSEMQFAETQEEDEDNNDDRDIR